MRLSKRWTRALAAAAVVAAVLAGAPAAQAVPTYTVTGTVTDRATGTPLPGACLSLFNTPELPVATRCTDDSGRYTFAGVTNTSTFRVRAQAAGHAELWWPSAPDYYNASYLTRSRATNGVLTADLALVEAVGGFTGRITQPDGSPAYASEVTAITADGSWKAKAPTDGDGRYRLGNLPAGSYRLAIAPRGNPPSQWVPGKTDSSTATAFAVTAGSTTTVDERYLVWKGTFEGGVFVGTVTAAATGAPVAGACVTAVSTTSGQDVAQACTDATGRYRIANVAIYLSYKLRIRADGFPDQWAPNAVDSRNAKTYYAQWATDVVADAALRVGGGTVRGQITDYPGATPALINSVRVVAVDSSWSAWTEAVDGKYQFDRVPPGDYRVAVKPLDRTIQYHPGKSLPEEATVVHVADGEVTTVDEELLPPGAVEVSLVDAVTGAPVPACGQLLRAQEAACGDSGTLTFPRIWATGATPDSLSINAKPTYWSRTISSVRVVTGETTRITVALEPAATLETSVVDARGGATPVQTCVYVVNAEKLAATPMRREAEHYCSDTTGKLRIGPLPAKPVQLLVVPPAPYGAQWYTENGGTGDRRLATVYRLTAGQSVTAPPIQLDLAGTLSGRVKDQSGKQVIARLRPFGLHPDLNYLGTSLSAWSTETGGYVLYGLGPYRWPVGVDGVDFEQGTLAPGWSGNATNRFDATMVQVTAGTTTTVPDIVLPQAARIRRLDIGTTPTGASTLEAYDPVTGDRVVYPVGVQAVDKAPLPPGPVLLRLVPAAGKPCWYAGPSLGPRGRKGVPPTPVNLTAGQVIDTFRLVPGETCRPEGPDTRTRPPVPAKPY